MMNRSAEYRRAVHKELRGEVLSPEEAAFLVSEEVNDDIAEEEKAEAIEGERVENE